MKVITSWWPVALAVISSATVPQITRVRRGNVPTSSLHCRTYIGSHNQLQSLKPEDPKRAELERVISQDWASIKLPKWSYTYAKEQKDEQAAKQTSDDLRNKRRADERAISDYLDIERPAQEFNKAMSEIFALLIGIVIVGFFALALLDAHIRQEVFANDSGLQFIALFSVVIAIILFGITEVLDGRELAALLGSLSGYILGRASTKGAPNPPVAPNQ